MPRFGSRSLRNLSTVDGRLQDLFFEVIKHYDCSVICGFRNEEDQNIAYHGGRSTKEWPDSKHNGAPSIAVDVIPWPVDWKNMKRFYHFVGIVMGIASQMGIKIRSGSDWDRDNDLDDQTLIDCPHFELIK